jgi:hypothetical protein
MQANAEVKSPVLNNGAVQPAVTGAGAAMFAPSVTAETLINANRLTATAGVNAPALLLAEPATRLGTTAGMVAPQIIAGRFITPFGLSMALTFGTPTIVNVAPSTVKPTGGSLTLTGTAPIIVNRALNPPVFDAVSTGISGGGSFTHTGAAGANVFLIIVSDQAVTMGGTPTYGGVNMTQLLAPTLFDGVGTVTVYRLTGIAAGAKTVSFSTSGGFFPSVQATTISYTGVVSLSTSLTTGSGTTASDTVPYTPGQTIVEILVGALASNGTTWSSISGGTARYSSGASGSVSSGVVLGIRQAGAATTFAASQATCAHWGALRLVLSDS